MGRAVGVEGRGQRQALSEGKAHQRPDLTDSILVREIAAKFGLKFSALTTADLPMTVQPLRSTKMQIDRLSSAECRLGPWTAIATMAAPWPVSS
jgi:hypothetical protein